MTFNNEIPCYKLEKSFILTLVGKNFGSESALTRLYFIENVYLDCTEKYIR